MRLYKFECIKERHQIYYLIRREDDGSIVELPTRFLMFEMRSKRSPNTVRMTAMSLSFYLNYMHEERITVEEVLKFPYDRQFLHFTDFLAFLKAGRHSERMVQPRNASCNAYLQRVFLWYEFLQETDDKVPSLKVLKDIRYSFVNSLGLRGSARAKTFPGYLPEEIKKGRTISREKIKKLLHACTNVRDKLMLLLIAETGFRIGELLGIRYATDLDLKKREIRVCFREDNENQARAKYAEVRSALISPETAEILTTYLVTYLPLIKDQPYLFINLTGREKGAPLVPNTVYAMMRELEKKTGIKVSPHMLRHYFANERRKDGWGIELISSALGHKSILTTVAYLDIDEDELVEASEEYYRRHGGMLDVSSLL